MLKVDRSSLREAGNLYILYAIAGIAAIPAGIVYSLLGIAGLERWWTALPLLAVALSMALLAWRYWERRLLGAEARTGQPLAPQVQLATIPLETGDGLRFALQAFNPEKFPLSFPPLPKSLNYAISHDEQLFEVIRGVGGERPLASKQIALFALSTASKNIRQTEIDIAIPSDKLRALAAGADSIGRAAPQSILIANQLGGR